MKDTFHSGGFNETELRAQIQAEGLDLKVHGIPGWYF